MRRALQAEDLTGDLAGLIHEQVDGVAGVVPEQMIGPRARLALGVQVGTAEKVGLRVHLLDIEFARIDPVLDVLVAGIEATHVPDHPHNAGALLRGDHLFGIGETVCHGNFSKGVLARLHGLHRLTAVHLRGRGQNDGSDIAGQKVLEASKGGRDAALGCQRLDLVPVGAEDSRHLNLVDVRKRIEMLKTKSAVGPGYTNFDHVRRSPESCDRPPCWRRGRGRSDGPR